MDGVNVTFTVTGAGGTNDAVAVVGPFTGTKQVVFIMQDAAAPPQPPNVDPLFPGAAVSISLLPVTSVEQLPEVRPAASWQKTLLSPETTPVPKPIRVTLKGEKEDPVIVQL